MSHPSCFYLLDCDPPPAAGALVPLDLLVVVGPVQQLVDVQLALSRQVHVQVQEVLELVLLI